MIEQPLPCDPIDSAPEALPIWPIRPAELDQFLAQRAPAQARFLQAGGFTGASQQLVLVPATDGIAGAAFGLGEDRTPHLFGDLPMRLPAGPTWRLAAGDYVADAAALGFMLGAYHFARFKVAKRQPARLVVDEAAQRRALTEASAIWMVRDLINTPANLLGPAELAEAAITLGRHYGAVTFRHAGEALDHHYPAVAAVGAGSVRPPVVAGFTWQGSAATGSSPLIALCGKGVVFDTGGNDIKSADNMLRMKKDMGGGATILGVARVLMELDLPLRLHVAIGCVENSVSGSAMRPLDVISTRRGLSVEIGNTDAEGRLVLADLLAEASDLRPRVVIDFATLTGAARAALGPDIPALFANDDGWAQEIEASGLALHDPMARMPLWDGYDRWLESPIADLNNVGTKSTAGAIVAALFLRRFLAPGVPWVHVDTYAWNDSARPGRPEGGDALGLRAVCSAIENRITNGVGDWNTPVT